MYRILLSIILCSGFALNLFSQNLMISRRIIATDTVMDDGVTFAASSDDAEKENDGMDALFDDDLDAGWEGAPDDQNILSTGLRFQNIQLPKGATIDSAYIVVCSHESKSKDDVAALTIYGHDADNSPTFTEDALIDARTKTSASVNWTVNEEWGLWTFHRSPDLKGIIQEVIDRGGWTNGNAVSFLILGKDQGPSDLENAREFESFENIADPDDGGDGQNHPDRVPELRIYYSVKGGMLDYRIMATDTVTDGGETFVASSDDAEQENDAIDALYDDDLDAGWEGAPDDQNVLTTGLRFQHIGIPKGATIDSAFIEVVSHESKTTDDVAELSIYGETADHAETFTEDALISVRPRTASKVEWTVDEEWGLWTTHRTPDLKQIVQEVVDRNGWKEGNSMVFVLLGKDQGPSDYENAREFESFENIADPDDGGDGQNHPERVPRFIVYYSSKSGNVSVKELQSTSEQLSIYPNPAQNGITVLLNNSTYAQIEIYELNGNRTKGISASGQRDVLINVSDLKTGIYMIRATQDGITTVQKFVIQ